MSYCFIMTEQDMLSSMCLVALGQGDLKAIGRSRGFDPEAIRSRELFRHGFLSHQGVRTALATLTQPEILGLHLLSFLGEELGLEFFKRVYPDSVSANRYGTYTERFKCLFHRVKERLIERGILLFGTPSEYSCQGAVLERRRFRLPSEFAPLLPAPFQARPVDAAVAVNCREKVLRNLLGEILRRPGEAGTPSSPSESRWGLKKGQLLFGGQPYTAERLKAWPADQLEAKFRHGGGSESSAFRPVPLLLYALSCLQNNEWAAADDLLPLWKMALPEPKTPEPRSLCEAGYDLGCLEMVEHEGTPCYRLPRLPHSIESVLPSEFLAIQNEREVRVNLDRIPLEALESVSEIAHFTIAEGSLRASPSLLKISQARDEILADAVFRWLREHHPTFRTSVEMFERKRGKLIVHENLLLARVADLSLKVMLERKFAAPGQLASVSSQFLAFPRGLLPEIQAWLNKSGHVIKTVQTDDSP